jgi:hypothetical protein
MEEAGAYDSDGVKERKLRWTALPTITHGVGRNNVEFARPKLVGPRYESHAIPLDALRELEAYGSVLTELAIELFRADHPQRRRLPHGFREGGRLVLARIGSGSAEAVIEHSFAPSIPDSVIDDVIVYFERAKRDFHGLLANVRRGVGGPSRERAAQALRRMGRRLRKDEAIVLPAGDGLPMVSIDRQFRREVLLAAAGEYSEFLDAVVIVHELDAWKKSIKFDLEPGATLTIQFGDTEWGQIHDLTSALADGPVSACFAGVVDYGSNDRPSRVVEVESLELADSDDVVNGRTIQDFRARFIYLRDLSAGWLDGGGEAPVHTLLVEARDYLLEQHRRFALPLPHVYPTPEGGISAEWTIGSHMLSLSWEPDGALLFDDTDLESGTNTTKDLPDRAALTVLLRHYNWGEK